MNKYLEQLRAALQRDNAVVDATVSTTKEDYDKPLTIEPALSVSGDVNQDLDFDAEGNAYITITKATLGITVHLNGFIAGLNSRFDIWLDTNYSEHKTWQNIGPDENIEATLKTNFFGKTTIKVKVHCSVPHGKATAKLHYST